MFAFFTTWQKAAGVRNKLKLPLVSKEEEEGGHGSWVIVKSSPFGKYLVRGIVIPTSCKNTSIIAFLGYLKIAFFCTLQFAKIGKNVVLSDINHLLIQVVTHKQCFH